jgi:hypothetical protein
MTEPTIVNDDRTFSQVAPYPALLEKLISELEYRPGWRFHLDSIDRGQGSEGLTFMVRSLGYDTYHPERGENYSVWHYFIVPAAAYDERSWRRWLLDRMIEIETHEVCEFFAIGGERPYAPSHGPGNDPYMIREIGTELDRRTSFRGDVDDRPS